MSPSKAFYRTLGRSGSQVSGVGLGCAAIGGSSTTPKANSSAGILGVLSGKYGSDTSFARNDLRSHAPYYVWFKVDMTK